MRSVTLEDDLNLVVLTEFLISWKPPCILTKTKPFVLAGGSVTAKSQTKLKTMTYLNSKYNKVSYDYKLRLNSKRTQYQRFISSRSDNVGRET